jgi:prepilin-type N-terminal cleavage/methylation domain-containing protein
MIKRFYNLIYKKYTKYRSCSGFTLVEVLIAMFLIALMAVGLIQGTTVAINALERNKEKTKAIAVANEKIELLKAMGYEEIGLTSENPGWEITFPELSEVGYSIYYYSAWVDDEENSYKQVMVSVINSDMSVPVEVVTRIYPSLGSAPEAEPGFPAPRDLVIDYDSGHGANREIGLSWTAPDTERVIDRYNVYRDGEFLGFALTEIYIDGPGDDNEYIYYVTTLYDDGTESDPSNSVTATTGPFYAPPQNLIDSYIGSGSSREVLLSWSTPDTPYTVIEYRIYRNGSFIGSTADEFYQDLIGTGNFTYYVTIYYEGGNESDPSNSVVTQSELTYPPPQNLSYTITGTNNQRWVHLLWEPPDSLLTIIEYRVYRDGGYWTSTTVTNFEERIRRNNYTYYITVLYEGGIESDPSNSVTTQ